MKRNTYAIAAIILMLIVLSSCATTQFDRTLLQPSSRSLSPKLPKLEVTGAETVAIGASNQVESSSMLYTIFRREVETNICDTIGLSVGSIMMELIYHDVQQNPGWSGKNLATIEFEVSILDSTKNTIWTNVYSGDLNASDSSLAWAFSYSDAAANNATAKLAHELIEKLKLDLQSDYDEIIQWL